MPEGKKILIVEDDKFLSSLVKSRLEKDGFTVLQVFDGEEAINFLDKDQPDLIVLDMIMPKVPGFEILEKISADPQLSGIPVIVLTNLGQESDVVKAKRLGATEYFVKARVSIDDIVQRIKSLLSQQ